MAFLQYDLKRFTESLATIDILFTKAELDTTKVVFTDAQNKSKEYPMKVSVLNLKGLIQLDHFGDKVAAKKSTPGTKFLCHSTYSSSVTGSVLAIGTLVRVQPR